VNLLAGQDEYETIETFLENVDLALLRRLLMNVSIPVDPVDLPETP
jgi:hypothetical protein